MVAIVISNLVLQPVSCLTSAMICIFLSRIRLVLPLCLIVFQGSAVAAAAASKPHIITFGKWITIQCFPESVTGTEDDKPLTLKARPLLIDAHVKEFTLGIAHDVTDRLFVIRRAFRVNDSLPQESPSQPHWQWQRGGWLLVDRITGHISPINLPEFDVVYSAASWYRDYAAYCGVSDDGKNIYAVVAQISRRKPILKKPIKGENIPEKDREKERDKEKDKEIENAPADPACPTPGWQRTPIRVTFEPAGAPKQTYAIRGHVADVASDSEEDEEASK
jgi:hypothetical protein